jgi:hypothetical protein
MLSACQALQNITPRWVGEGAKAILSVDIHGFPIRYHLVSN